MDSARITKFTQLAGLLALTLALITFFGPVSYTKYTVLIYWVAAALAAISIGLSVALKQGRRSILFSAGLILVAISLLVVPFISLLVFGLPVQN